mmetsp:Transcript_18392/g.46051  ORF Transcript_18392/g.46051 Transcript_18392/m.46051 type:complete len:210 (+) Transcript_18392:1057-1686(+)
MERGGALQCDDCVLLRLPVDEAAKLCDDSPGAQPFESGRTQREGAEDLDEVEADEGVALPPQLEHRREELELDAEPELRLAFRRESAQQVSRAQSNRVGGAAQRLRERGDGLVGEEEAEGADASIGDGREERGGALGDAERGVVDRRGDLREDGAEVRQVCGGKAAELVDRVRSDEVIRVLDPALEEGERARRAQRREAFVAVEGAADD